MAGYQFLTSEPTIQIIGSDIVRDAQRVTAQATTSGVVFSLLFAPYPTDPQGTVIWTADLIAQQLAQWAGYWDSNSQVPGVAAIGLSQEINAVGQLHDIALVIVSSTSGKSQSQLILTPRDFFPDSFPPRVAAEREQLDAVEAGGGG